MCTSQKYKMYLQSLVGAKPSRCTLGFSELRLEVGVYSQTKTMLSRNKTLDQARAKGTAELAKSGTQKPVRHPAGRAGSHKCKKLNDSRTVPTPPWAPTYLRLVRRKVGMHTSVALGNEWRGLGVSIGISIGRKPPLI